MKFEVVKSGSAGNCYALHNDSECLIIECGVSIAEIPHLGEKNIVGCLVTHEHGDHAKYTNTFAAAGIDIYATVGTHSKINISNYRKKYITAGIQFQLGEFLINPFLVSHDAVEPVGFYIYHKEIGYLVFVTDSNEMNVEFKAINFLIIEANYSEKIMAEKAMLTTNEFAHVLHTRVKHTHLSLEKAIAFASQYPLCDKIFLIHLSDNNSDSDYFRLRFEASTGVPTVVPSNNSIYELHVN